MTINRKNWLWFISASLISIALWRVLTYPQFAFVHLAIDRNTAKHIAEDYLAREREVDLTPYRRATVFSSASGVDKYLQKAIGFRREIRFLTEHDYELFFWTTRFFRENEKEEYSVTVSAATGEVTAFSHRIKDGDARPARSQAESRDKVFRFLQQKFGINPDDYLIHNEHSIKHDNRTDYSFSWEKRNVFVRWSEEPDSGGAKLLTGATVSGDEILSFRKIQMDIPEPFYRFMAKQANVGRNLGMLFRILYYVLLTASIFYVVVRRNDLVMHTVKRFCLILTGSLFLVHIAAYFNEFENVIFAYPTTSSFVQYLGRHVLGFIMDAFIVTIAILMPCLSGESLHFETLRERREGAFLHYLTSTIFSRNVSRAIVLGYLAAIIMVGIQSLAFEIGQRYWGVWVEHVWMAQLSSGYLPFLSAFIIGYSASTSEEVAFRLFSISLGKKFLKRTLWAVLIASIIWGFGHTTYRVFPMWFRGLEVSLLGLFLGYVYLRYGIIPVLVAHYLFDVFWSSSAYLLGHSKPYHFYSSVAVLLLPLVWGLVSYLLNRPETERPLRWRLTRHQVYNLQILKNYLKTNPPPREQSLSETKKEIVSHGWDIAVVEIALADFQRDSPAQD